MGTTASQPSLNMESIPDNLEDTHQEKLEENLSRKVTGFLLAESDLPLNALSSKHIEMLLHCRTSGDVGELLNEIDAFYDPYFDTTLRLIIFINNQRS